MPGLGPHPRHPPAAALPSSAPLFQLDGFPARSSRTNLGFWRGEAASGREGRGGERCISNARALHPRKHPRNCSHMLAPTARAPEPQIPFSAPRAAVQPSQSQPGFSSPALGQESSAPVLHHGPANPAGAAGNFQYTLKPHRKIMDPGLYRSPGPSFSFFPPSLLHHEYLSPRLGCLLGIPAGIPPSPFTECSPGPGRGGGSAFHSRSPHPRWRVNIVPLTKAGIVAGRGKARGGGRGRRSESWREGGHGRAP